MHTFGKSLVALNIDPPEEHLRRKEFFDAYSATARRVLETTNEQKIKDFAALFASYYDGKTFSSIDHYEEYLSILHDLSHREFQVLVTMHKLETENPVKPGENLLMRANRIWKEFSIAVESEVGIVQGELLAVLTRVERTGLYTPIVGAYLDYTRGTRSFDSIVCELCYRFANRHAQGLRRYSSSSERAFLSLSRNI